MINIHVSTERIAAQVQQLENLTFTLQGQFEMMETLLRDTGRYWIGSAADAERNRYTEKKDRISEILGEIGRYPASIYAMNGNYTAVEAANEDVAEYLSGDVIV